MSTNGSVSISKGYYNNGTHKIITQGLTASLADLKQNQTVGCKNDLYMTTASGTVAPYITSLEAPTGTFDATVKLDTPVYLNWTKEYIAGGTEIAPEWSFVNSDLIPNYTTAGSPTISSDYIASGFNSSNYISAGSFNPGANSWEIGAKVHTKNSISGTQWLLNSYEQDHVSIALYFSNPDINVGSGSWYGGQVWIDRSIATDTDYWYKMTYDGTRYAVLRSTDGTNYTEIAYISDSRAIGAVTNLVFGRGDGSFVDSIDLKTVYVKVNGVETWRAVEQTEPAISTTKALSYDSVSDKTYWYPSATSEQLSNFLAKADKNNILYTNKTGKPTSNIVVSGNGTEYVKNFTEVKTPTISNDFAVSGFDSGSNYKAQGIETLVNFDPSLPWELNLRFKTNTLTHDADHIVLVGYGMTSSRNIYIYIHKTSHVPSVAISFDGTTNTYLSDSSFVIQDNTEYWLRLEWNGSQYRIFYSTDGITFTKHGLKSSSSPIYVETPMYMSFGFKKYTDTSSGGKFEGTIYMKDCNLKSNGTVIWTGAEGYIADSTKTDSKYVWLNHAHDKIIGVQEEPDEVVLEAPVPFQQPVLSSAGTLGGDSFAIYYDHNTEGLSRSYYAFRDFNVYTGIENDRLQTNNTSTSTQYYLTMYNPYEIRVSSIKIRNAEGVYSFQNYTVYGSNDNSSWVTLATGTNNNTTTNDAWTITVDATASYKYIRLGFYPRSSTAVMMCRVLLQATSGAAPNTIEVSKDHYWTYLKDSTYNCEGKSLNISSMTGTALSGYLLATPAGTLVYTGSNHQGLLGDAFLGYTVTFTDTSHSAIELLTKTGTRCRCYSAYNGNVENPQYYFFYVTSLPVTGEIPMTTSGAIGEKEITPSSSTSSYTYDAATDTITYSGYTASYIGDVYVNLGA